MLMVFCEKENGGYCENLVIKVAKKEGFKGRYFFGCKNFPECREIIPTEFNEKSISIKEKQLLRAFGLFVRSNLFLDATYGTVYFNFRNAGLLDYALKSNIISEHGDPIEIGYSKAKIFYSLFYHLYIIPDGLLKLYLRNNFPNSYERFNDGLKPVSISSIDYDNNIVLESEFIQYKDVYLNY